MTKTTNIRDMYDMTNIIQYTNSNEYRSTIRKTFKMDNNATTAGELIQKGDIDDESWDELLYDSDTITKTMDLIYDLTKDNMLFAELYEAAAAQMISVEKTIGQAVVMSYDYYYMYHLCLCAFFQSPETFNETSQCYLQLKRALTK
jgi:hypothetical protein